MTYNIVLLPGDGIGPEIVAAAAQVLEKVGEVCGHSFAFSERLIGGIAIDQTGNPLPEETVAACRDSDAILLGAVGGPKWDDPAAKTRPEAGLLGIRKALSLFANLRPIKPFEELLDASPLKREVVEGNSRQRGRAESRWVAEMGVRERVREERPSFDRDTGAYTGTNTYERPYEEAPGISPLLVAELLDHAIYFALQDLGKWLPTYEEIALPVLSASPAMSKATKRFAAVSAAS